MMDSLASCFICGQALESDKLVPIFGSGSDSQVTTVNEDLAKFKESFQCFCELLGINVGEGSILSYLEKITYQLTSVQLSPLGGGEQKPGILRNPCCSDCCGALDNILRLQREIDELKVNQIECVKKLEVSLLSVDARPFTDDDNDQSWCQIRKTLLSKIKNQNCEAGSRKSDDMCGTRTRVSDVISEIQEASSPGIMDVDLDDFDADAFPPLRGSDADDFNPPKGPQKRARRQRVLKRSSVPPPVVVPVNENNSTTEKPDFQKLIKPCSVILRRLPPTSLECKNEDPPKEIVPSATGSAQAKNDDNIPITKSKQNIKRRKKVGTKPNNLFWKLTDRVLLYKYTLIEATCGSTHLKCLEEGCHFEVVTFDFLNLFQSMKDHIDSIHFPPTTSTIINCPHSGCQMETESGQKFRSHLASSHILQEVFCEICWKPMKHCGDNYKIHNWSHKNNEEQAASEVPKKVIYNATIRKRISWEYRRGLRPPRQPKKDCSTPPPTKNKKLKKPPKPEMKSKASLKTVSNCLQNDFFLQLHGDLFLYKYTFLRASPQGGVSCLEPDCSYHVPEGMDYVALEDFRKHVEECHITENPNDYIHTSRQCILCPETKYFSTGPALRYHLYFSKDHLQHRDFYYVCQSCGKPFRQPPSMKTHVLSHQSPDERPGYGQDYDPAQCNSSDFPFVCSKCGKRFRTSGNLCQHEPIHLPKTLRKQFPCPHCPAMLMSRAAVRNHVEAIHQPELKTRNCPICGKEFNQKKNYKFKIHMRGHTNELPYVCEICGKGYKARHQLRQHQKDIHLQDRGYKCEFCERSYKYSENLRRHKVTAHKDKLK